MTAIVNRSTHSVSLLDGEIVEENDLGSIRRVTADNFPDPGGYVHEAAGRQPGCHAYTALARQRQ